MHQLPDLARPTCSRYPVRTAHNGTEGTHRRSRPKADRAVLLANAGTESHAVVARTSIYFVPTDASSVTSCQAASPAPQPTPTVVLLRGCQASPSPSAWLSLPPASAWRRAVYFFFRPDSESGVDLLGSAASFRMAFA